MAMDPLSALAGYATPSSSSSSEDSANSSDEEQEQAPAPSDSKLQSTATSAPKKLPDAKTAETAVKSRAPIRKRKLLPSASSVLDTETNPSFLGTTGTQTFQVETFSKQVKRKSDGEAQLKSAISTGLTGGVARALPAKNDTEPQRQRGERDVGDGRARGIPMTGSSFPQDSSLDNKQGSKRKGDKSAKDRVKAQRMKGQSGIGNEFRTWRSETEMQMRQQFD